ncbi:MAG: substrate-binding and VWA domain-containing protein [Oscillospiraceae bacterium]|jgi:Ca-activated chloride channel family protein|nr:substrate-binding and VWA domain-containing protein [Oscillospiraceae bacterium]
MNFFKNTTVKLVLIAVVVFGLIFSVVTVTRNWGKTKDTVDTEAALKKLDSLYGKLNVTTLTPRKESVDLSAINSAASLPDISLYPFVAQPETVDYIEIYSSPEKAGSSYESWLIDVADRFNKSGASVDGKPVSVGVRNISSGLGVDYITSGKYKPDVFAPSNELWGDMLTDKGIKVTMIEKRIAGNVAGVVLSKIKNDEIVKKYGAINSNIIVDAVLNGELAMGYTNPFASSTGLNFLLTTLYTLDKTAPLGDAAISRLQSFQDNIPYVAYNTMQMKESAKSGSLDGFVLEYQTYVNSPDIKSNHTFTPFGVRHDAPVYEVGELPEIKKQIARQFMDFCKTPESQKMASDKGFNGLDSYVYEFEKPDGAVISQAQQIWKKEKNGTSELTAVFVADISGSMDGAPLLKLKESLTGAAKYINSETNIGLVTFSDNVNLALPIAKFDLNQRAYFTGAVKDMRAGGGTAMFDAIAAGMKMLTDAKVQNPGTKLMLFVLTDGETNRGYSLNNVESVIRNLKIPIYTIGYNADISVLQNLSNINEATSINAETDDVAYKLESLFNAQM